MVLSLDIISDNPQLNTFSAKKNYVFASGETVTVVMRLWQSDLNIRYIPDAGATISVDLKKSDNTILTKTCSNPFADDRSIIQFSLSAAESAEVIGQNLVVKVTEGSDVHFAVLQYGLSKVIPDGSC